MGLLRGILGVWTIISSCIHLSLSLSLFCFKNVLVESKCDPEKATVGHVPFSDS